MAGTALVYPGWRYINWGIHITENPMVVSGMAAVYVPWATVPVMTVVIVTFIFLVMRTFLMRGDDPFHVVLWVRMCPLSSIALCIVCTPCKLVCSSPALRTILGNSNSIEHAV